jgi:phage terminase large subunit GpA-like protein
MVQQHIGQLLPPVAAAAHTAQKALQTNPMRAIPPTLQRTAQTAEFELTLAQARWLCGLAGQQALHQQAAAVLCVRRVPKEIAVIVQQAGLQLTTENLVAAARSRAEGLENWLVEPYCTKLDPVVLAVLNGRGVSYCMLC